MRILVIEDEKKVANFIKQGLEEERYIVDVAYDGEEGMELAFSNNFDCIVLDVLMPGKDGFEILKEMRYSNLSTPVLLLTALGTVEDRVHGLDLGADDYLPKPFSFEELVARVRAIMRRSSNDKSTKLKAGELLLDTVTHVAYKDGKEIELTTKEYGLLEILMRNKNRILSRANITQHVWKNTYKSDSNIIDVYIKRIRMKIEEEGSQPTIQAVRGVGYRLRDTTSEPAKNNKPKSG